MRLIDADSLIEEINNVYAVEEKEDLKWAKGLHYAKTIIRNMPTIEDDALALLKEPEAVKPKSKVRHGANAQIQHFCGNCMKMLHGKPKFCSECGRPILWEGR